MKSCHFYYIQRKTDGATEENLFCRNPILLGILGPTASPSGYFRESPRSCFLVSILCSSWYPFPLWRDFGRWGLESVLGRTGRSMFILVSSGCHSKTPQTGGRGCQQQKCIFSGLLKSKIRVPARLLPREAPFLTCSWLSYHRVVTW